MKMINKIFCALVAVLVVILMLTVIALSCFYTMAFFLSGTIVKGIITAVLTFCFTVASCIIIAAMKDIFSGK